MMKIFSTCLLILVTILVVACSDVDDKSVFVAKSDIEAGSKLAMTDFEMQSVDIENTSGIATYHFVESFTAPGVIAEREINRYIGKVFKRNVKSGAYLTKPDFGEQVEPLF